jgi:hypothetical protein
MIAWWLALATALWFGLMAAKAQRAWGLWTVGGGLFALVTTTIVLGLEEAAFIPFSSREDALFHWRAIGISILIVLVFGWLFTMGLHQQHRLIGKALKAIATKLKILFAIKPKE